MKENKKSKVWLIILIMLVVGLGVGFGVSKMTSMMTNDKAQVEETNTVEETEEVVEDTPEVTEKTEVEEAQVENDPANAASTSFTTISTNSNAANYGGKDIKARLKRWVGIASTYNYYSGTSTLEEFGTGLKSNQLSKALKLKMTYNAIFYDKKTTDYTLTKSDVSKMESTINKTGCDGESVKIMKISDFNSDYKGLFQEDMTYTLKDLDFGCPTPWAMDNSSDRIFLFSRCGGTGVTVLKAKITSINSDNSYYYVHQIANIFNSATNKNDKSYKILWKFDKNLKFVSTSKE